MPSRRSLLANGGLAASAALTASVTLAGCSTVTGPPGVAADVRGGALDVPEAEEAPIVARAEASSGDPGCPEGKVDAEARVHEIGRADDPTELVLVAEYDVITGESGCSSGWGQTGIEVSHDWRADAVADDAGVESRQSNVVPTSDDGREQATLERNSSGTTAGWQVHLTPPTRSTMTYRFASRLAASESLAEGDVLATLASETRVRRGWLGGKGVLETGATLTYGAAER